MPFCLKQVDIISKLKATIDLFTTKAERLAGGKFERIEQVLEKSFESITACLWAERRDL